VATGACAARASVRIAADQPVLGQLLFTPAVPGFVPSEQAYAPSVRANELLRTAIARAVQRRQLHPAAASDNGVALFIALVAGIAIQQTANDPNTGFDEGCYTALLDPALDMYAGYFAASFATNLDAMAAVTRKDLAHVPGQLARRAPAGGVAAYSRLAAFLEVAEATLQAHLRPDRCHARARCTRSTSAPEH
jgi:hypothetical protein